MSDQTLQLLELFTRFSSQLEHYARHRRRFPASPVNPARGQGRILTLLKLQPCISQKDLSYLLDIQPQSLGELLGKLEKSGFILRNPSEKDRRILEITLTPEGKAAAEELEIHKMEDNEIFDSLSQQEQEDLYKLLSKLCISMEQKLSHILPEERNRSFRKMRDDNRRMFMETHGRHGRYSDR